MISIVNYNLGNIGSIMNMLRYLGKPAKVINTPEELRGAGKIILPGVGSFDSGMEQLELNGWIEPLTEKVLVENTPVLGICLGMHLMMETSEEGRKKGLGWIKGNTRKFNVEKGGALKVPHMGWNEAIPTYPDKLFDSYEALHRFYFVHSYYVVLEAEADVFMTSNYGIDFTAGLKKENILAVQFHPEKSHRYGMELLRNFADYY